MIPSDGRKSEPPAPPAADSTDGPSRAWQASRYLLGEVSPEDAAAFEAALDDDQALRDLLADSVEFHLALRHVAAAARRGPGVLRRPIWPRVSVARASFLAAVAASVLAAFSWSVGPIRPDPTDEPSVLASHWADIHGLGVVETGPNAADYAAGTPDQPSPADATGEGNLNDPGSGPSPERPIPSWLIAATLDDPADGETPVGDANAFEEN